MAKKILVPVFPSERFYEAVLRAADILQDEGGLITFVFTRIRPMPGAEGDARMADVELAPESGDFDARDIEEWRERQVAGLEEARQLLFERGIGDDSLDYLFADEADHEGMAQAIADEAAAGAYDLVILSRGYFEQGVADPGDTDTVEDVAAAVQALGDGVHLVVA